MRLAPLFFGAVILSTTACTTIQVYREPVTQLSEATVKTREAIETLSHDANDAKRRAKALEHAVASAQFGANDMTAVVHPDYIKARVAGLRMIERFLSRLTAVVEAKNDNVPKYVDALAEDAAKLATSLQNSQASNYAAPLGGLAKAVIALYDEHRREVILKKGVSEGVPHVKKLIEILKSELGPGAKVNIEEVTKEELKSLVTARIAAYKGILAAQLPLSNVDKGKPEHLEARIAAVEKIIEAQEALDKLSLGAALSTLQSMEEALDSLADLAKQESAPPDKFSVFLSRVTVFSERAVTLLEAANAIHKVTNEAKK